MKMKSIGLTTVLLTAALTAATAFAQMGSGPGGGMGPGGKGRLAWNQDYTPGWTLMSPEERSAWQAQMREVKTYEECKATQESHRSVMEERAKEKGVKLRPQRHSGCDVMKTRGLIQ
ncbi:MAG: hypothetical protein OHM77_03685 [Candidatus Nitricoxidivorans perseverans]|uniref:Uncharacterized protein n=1 Tax=Candidatus Nitricoxidivorans perseverans TaxID=2975601 RepID=A0AA49FN82_9PROT|nr:MAG: hypothetical protein OHM77_03685 [Candidatus Nitricoxidivorans perseverans]